MEVCHEFAEQSLADPQAAGQLLLGAKDSERGLQQLRRTGVHPCETTTAGFWMGRPRAALRICRIQASWVTPRGYSPCEDAAGHVIAMLGTRLVRAIQDARAAGESADIRPIALIVAQVRAALDQPV